MALLFVLTISLAPPTVTRSAAQPNPSAPSRSIQAGIGVLPGIGVQVGFIDQERMYTRDVVFQAHLQPGLFENSGNVQISGVIGASLQIFGILETIGAIEPRTFDIHVGARIGPGLTFAFDESSLEKNQRFSLTLEPVARAIQTIGGRFYYVEVGIVRPSIRFGMMLRL